MLWKKSNLIFIIILLLVSQLCFGATEDLTTYTEVDTNSRFSQNATRNTITALPRSDDAYVYKDYTAGHFGNYTHTIDISWGGSAETAFGGIWGATNNPGSYPDMSTGQVIYLYDNTINIDQLNLRDQGNTNVDTYLGELEGGYYYLTISRSGTTGTCLIYSDLARTSLTDTLTITVQSTTWRYGVVGFSRDAAGSSAAIWGYCENFDLGEAAPPAVDDSQLFIIN